MSAEHQLSFRGKPWEATNHDKNVEEANGLKLTRSFLYAQIRDIDNRLRVLNTEILDHILARTSEPPAVSDYGITQSPLDIQAKTSPKGLFRNFRGH